MSGTVASETRAFSVGPGDGLAVYVPASVVSSLNRLTPIEVQTWTRRLDATARPCGCKSGAALTLVALVSWPAWIVVSGLPRTALEVGAALVSYVLVVIAAAVAGKLVGIAVGRRRHSWLRRRLMVRLALVTAAREA
jgi:hypothetical protein